MSELSHSLAAFSHSPFPPSCAYHPQMVEIFNSSPSFAFDLNFFNRSLKTGTTFRSLPRVPGSKLPPLSALFRDTLGVRGDISVFALQMAPGSQNRNLKVVERERAVKEITSKIRRSRQRWGNARYNVTAILNLPEQDKRALCALFFLRIT